MGKRWYVIAAAAAGGLVISGVLATPAAAWDGGANLKVGDVVCTDQSRSDIGARFYGHVTDGSATATIRVASSVGGAETVVWSLTGSNLNIGKTVPASAAGTYFRGCVTITAATSNTWTNMAILPSGASAAWDLGPHTAVLSPGARACGDNGMGPVRLIGNASAPVMWSINGTDEDCAFVGTVFSVSGQSVDQTFVPSPDLTLLEMCVTNTAQQTITASFELVQL